MSISVDGEKRVDDPFRAFQRSARGVVCAVRVLWCVVLCCAVLCVVLCVVCSVVCVLSAVCCVSCVVCRVLCVVRVLCVSCVLCVVCCVLCVVCCVCSVGCLRLSVLFVLRVLCVLLVVCVCVPKAVLCMFVWYSESCVLHIVCCVVHVCVVLQWHLVVFRVFRERGVPNARRISRSPLESAFSIVKSLPGGGPHPPEPSTCKGEGCVCCVC